MVLVQFHAEKMANGTAVNRFAVEVSTTVLTGLNYLHSTCSKKKKITMNPNTLWSYVHANISGTDDRINTGSSALMNWI